MIRRLLRPVRCSVILGLTGVAGFAITACQTQTTADLASAEERPECPHAPQFTIVDSSNRQVTETVIGDLPLSGKITSVPEFHDCQRFVVDSAEHEIYGSLYAIYSRQGLNLLEAAIDSLQDTLVYPQYRNRIAAVPAATVVSYGGSTYDPGRYDGGVYDRLHIKPGFNCLYLWRQDTLWRAWVINKGLNDPNCPQPQVMDATAPPGAELKVSRVLASPGQGVPEVARWDWDSAGREQYIGIKCGSVAWCEVSDDRVASPQPAFPAPNWETNPAIPDLDPSDDERLRVHRIKGWYDAQRLALRTDGGVVPSPVWGVIVPHPTLHRMSYGAGKAFSKGRWVHVAAAWVTADYHGAVLALKQGQQNNIHLCYGTADNCGIVDPKPACAVPSDSVTEWMRVSYANEAPKHYCGIRRPAAQGVQVPGTVRWRWLALDETLWTRCSEGCCELQQ